ncbi:MAG: Methyltransferase type 11 [Actinoallomurus sp.]|jgi:ubiquinone/menaquinone biosynthesis C-methylase UbiE|nr:Methyltransferase type 11 [Actinoallomurus sp.]
MYGSGYAEIYDLIHSWWRGKDYDTEAAEVTEMIRARMPEASSLLDVACGTGIHLARFAESFDHIEGLDLSEAMLSVARRRMPAAELRQGDMRSLDLPRRFDAITCMFTAIAHQTEVELDETLRRFARHLNPGGVVVVDPWWFPETFIEGYVSAEVMTPDHRSIARVSHATREGDWSRMEVHYLVVDEKTGIRHFTEPYRHRLITRGQYEQALRDAGFTTEYLEGFHSGRGLFLGVLTTVSPEQETT